MSRTDGQGLYFVKKAYEEHQPCTATNCRPETHVRSYRRCGQPIGPKILLVHTGERLCRNDVKYEPMLRHIPEQATPQLHRGGSSTPRTPSD